MEIGNLNQRITILEHRTVIDEIGNHTTKWEETFSLWAKVTVKTATVSSPESPSLLLDTFIRIAYHFLLSVCLRTALYGELSHKYSGSVPYFFFAIAKIFSRVFSFFIVIYNHSIKFIIKTAIPCFCSTFSQLRNYP